MHFTFVGMTLERPVLSGYIPSSWKSQAKELPPMVHLDLVGYGQSTFSERQLSGKNQVGWICRRK